MKVDTMSDEAIGPGYKQTEVGIIPRDWEVKRLDEFGKWKGGATPSMANMAFWVEGSIPWASSSDIRDVSLSSTEKNITDRAVRESSTMLLPAGALLIVTRSGILRRYLPVTLNTIPVAINQDIKALLLHKGVSSHYLLQALLKWGPEILATCMKAGTTVESIEYPWLKKFAIPMPRNPEEQRAIAEVLSDVDALLDALDRLIAKKRAIKQGTMQALLTGRVRLPGFTRKPGYKRTEVGVIPEDWQVKRLSELFEITSSKRVFQSEWRTEGIPFYRARELAVLSERGHVHNELFISDVMYEEFKKMYGVPSPGDMLVTGVGTLGKVYIVPNDHEFYFKDGNIIWYKIQGSVVPEFLRHLYLTKLIIKQINDGSAGTTVGTYTISGAKNTIIPFPDLSEQRAIAEVLSDMDAEIDALEERRAKLRDIKQGMMQALLTGRIRLVQPKEKTQEAHV